MAHISGTQAIESAPWLRCSCPWSNGTSRVLANGTCSHPLCRTWCKKDLDNVLEVENDVLRQPSLKVESVESASGEEQEEVEDHDVQPSGDGRIEQPLLDVGARSRSEKHSG